MFCCMFVSDSENRTVKLKHYKKNHRTFNRSVKQTRFKDVFLPSATQATDTSCDFTVRLYVPYVFLVVKPTTFLCQSLLYVKPTRWVSPTDYKLMQTCICYHGESLSRVDLHESSQTLLKFRMQCYRKTVLIHHRADSCALDLLW